MKTNPKKKDYCSIIYNKAKQSEELNTTEPLDSSFISVNELNTADKTYSLVIFHIDLIRKHVELIRISKDLQNLKIQPVFRGKNGIGLSGGRQWVETSTAKLRPSRSLPDNETTSIQDSLNQESDSLKEFMEFNGQLKYIDFNITNSSISFKVNEFLS